MLSLSTDLKGYTFDEEHHVHRYNGKPLTGVTSVLQVINKPGLIQWSANETIKHIREHAEKYNEQWLVPDSMLEEAKVAHRKKKEDAGTKGTDVHAQIEELINEWIGNSSGFAKSSLLNDNKQVQNFIDWALAENVQFLESERHVYSTELWLGGIADIVCVIRAKRYVGDVKTGSGIYPEHYLQTSVYSYMMQEMGLYDKFDGVVILNCKKDGKFEYQYNYDLEGNMKGFCAALDLLRTLEALKTKKLL